MYSANALSYTSAVSDWLTNTDQPHILHIFDRACNLINDCREVLSIVTPQIGNGPFNLVIEDELCFSDHLNLQSPITINFNQLRLGDFLTIHTTNANLWSPRPDWEMLHVSKADVANQLQKLPMTNYQPLLPQSLISNLSSALANADIPSTRTTTAQLAGLGNGLTPAGDDFLLGAIYAAWIIHPPEIAGIFAAEIANTAAPLTTSLSAAWLRAAGRGEAGILWHALFDALLFTDAVNIQKLLDKILSVGETSGTDALAGFFRTMIFRSKEEMGS